MSELQFLSRRTVWTFVHHKIQSKSVELMKELMVNGNCTENIKMFLRNSRVIMIQR